MSDFDSNFWNVYIVVITVTSIVACGIFLWLQSTAKLRPGETTGHVWDEDLQEYNNPLPNWWRWLFYLTIAFGLTYLVLYPGLGRFEGRFKWTSANAYQHEMHEADEHYGPLYRQFQQQDIRTVAANAQAREMGQRLFMTYCAQCHGSDARGAKGFPDLTDKDWLFGGTPEKIEETIAKGRDAAMPAKGLKPDLSGEEIKNIAHYVRSLSGLTADSIRAQQGKPLFAAACVACHGVDGRGAEGVAPNLADKIWLYGSAESTIVETITNGRVNHMPAFGEFLGDAKVHLLAAYVYGLGGGVADAAPAGR
jgi:cytochrome c oxidase cbb3-type subunit 3